MYRRGFIYSTGAVSVGASATVNTTLQIANDADFEVLKLTAQATSSNFTINIQDSTSGVYYMNRAIHALLLLGSNTDPFILPVPILIRANSALTITLVDQSAAANTIWIGFYGNKIYGQRTQTFPEK